MAHGLITAVDIQAGVNTVIYTMPAGLIQVLNLNISNRNNKDVKVRLAIMDGGLDVLTDANWLEYDTILRKNGLIIRYGLALNGEQSLVGYSDAGNVNFVLWG